jgi:uncharacterized SAM-binding protein YcdF (DUF218 family)
LNSFLAIDRPVGAPVMVVEGWLPRFAYREAARRFLEGRYGRIIVAGVRDEDYRHSGDGTPDDFGVADLIASGVPAGDIITAIAENTPRDRTYHAALAVKDALESQRISAATIDVVTVGAHARRSQLLFSKALGDGRRIGVIGIEDRRFDTAHWWRSSEGVRTVLGEAIAFAYARLVFTVPE